MRARSYRHSFYSRFLFTVISSALYYKDTTVDGILAEFSRQAISLYEKGVAEARPMYYKVYHMCGLQRAFLLMDMSPRPHQDKHGEVFRLVFIGGKGDWVWQRKVPCQKLFLSFVEAFCLATGFTCKRVCHLCTSVAPCLQVT